MQKGLKDWIHMCKEKGWSPRQIADAMKKQDYKEKQIGEALALYHASAGKTQGSRATLVIAVALVIIIAGLFLLLRSPKDIGPTEMIISTTEMTPYMIAPTPADGGVVFESGTENLSIMLEIPQSWVGKEAVLTIMAKGEPAADDAYSYLVNYTIINNYTLETALALPPETEIIVMQTYVRDDGVSYTSEEKGLEPFITYPRNVGSPDQPHYFSFKDIYELSQVDSATPLRRQRSLIYEGIVPHSRGFSQKYTKIKPHNSDWPVMRISVDDKGLDEIIVDSREWRLYEIPVHVGNTKMKITVDYLNNWKGNWEMQWDWTEQPPEYERNLYLKEFNLRLVQ